jgi:hypothetical protein
MALAKLKSMLVFKPYILKKNKRAPFRSGLLKSFSLLVLILVQAFHLSAQQPRSSLMKTFTIEEFQQKFDEIKKLGWIKTKRKGNTGIGQTLEQLLGLNENNFALPDLGTAELKSHRIGSPSMVTLFTFDRNAWKMSPLEAIRKYGTRDANGRLGLYFTLSNKPNGSGLYLRIEQETISVRHTSGVKVAEWSTGILAQRFVQKMSPGLVVVYAQSEMRDGVEWLKYERAQLLTEPSPEKFLEQLKLGNVLVDLRLHDRGTSARNHGTGFRTREDKIPLLFKRVVEL